MTGKPSASAWTRNRYGLAPNRRRCTARCCSDSCLRFASGITGHQISSDTRASTRAWEMLNARTHVSTASERTMCQNQFVRLDVSQVLKESGNPLRRANVPENVPAAGYARPTVSQREPTEQEVTPRQIGDSPRGSGASHGLITQKVAGSNPARATTEDEGLGNATP
jgi:hypothetical protein